MVSFEDEYPQVGKKTSGGLTFISDLPQQKKEARKTSNVRDKSSSSRGPQLCGNSLLPVFLKTFISFKHIHTPVIC